MFSLIVVLVSIALVAALALATIYYGGAGFSNGHSSARATTLVNQSQQLMGALEIYKVQTGQWPNSLAELTPQYLKTLPVPVAQLEDQQFVTMAPVAFAQEVAATWELAAPQQPVIRLSAPVSTDLCRAVNAKARGDDGILTQAYSHLQTQCYGATLSSLKVVSAKDGEHLTAALAGEDVAQGAMPDGSAAAGWLVQPGSNPVPDGSDGPGGPGDTEEPPTETPAGSASLSFTPATLSFTNVGVSETATATSTLRNSGTTAATGLAVSSVSGAFSRTTTCGTTLAAAAECQVTVSFSPSAATSYSGSLTASAAAAQATLGFNGEGELLTPNVTASASSLVFEDTVVMQTSGPRQLTLTNNGNGPAVFTGIDVSVGRSDFGSSNNCDGALAAGASCVVDVTMTPAVRGARSGTLSVVVQGVEHALNVSLSGTGLGPNVTVNLTDVSKPSVQEAANGAVSQVFQYTNSGQTPAAISLQVTGAGWTDDSSIFAPAMRCGTTLAVGATCRVRVSHSLAAQGVFVGTVTMTVQGMAMPIVSTVTVTVTPPPPPAPELRFVFPTLNYGTLAAVADGSGPSATQSFRLWNGGTATATLTALTQLSGSPDFVVESTDCGATLAVDDQCYVYVRFAPRTVGTFTGTFSIGDVETGTAVVGTATGSGQ